MRALAPKKRFAICVKGTNTYCFAVLPKAATTSSSSSSTNHQTHSSTSSAVEAHPTASSSTSAPAKDCSRWSAGSYTVPLKVNQNGELSFCPEFPRSSFESLAQAIAECGPFLAVEEYAAVFGCMLLDKMYFLVASKSEVVMELPFGGTVYNVLATQWVGVALPSKVPKLSIGTKDVDRLKALQRVSYAPGGYYCEEVDMRLPFPFLEPAELNSNRKKSSSSSGGGNTPQHMLSPSLGPADTPLPPPPAEPIEFHSDWSEHLRRPFQKLGLEWACTVLLRGFVGEQRIALQDGQLLRMQLIGRQNHLNPGPRYYGRGLNHVNATGNDHVYELVLWRYVPEADETVVMGSSSSTKPADLTTTTSIKEGEEENDASRSSTPDCPPSPLNRTTLPSERRPPSPTDRSRTPSRPATPSAPTAATATTQVASPTTATYSGSLKRNRIQFARHVILRGTIPVHWTTEIPAGISEAIMRFDSAVEKVVEGSYEYFKRVFGVLEGFLRHDSATTAKQQQVGASLRCVNLLRQHIGGGEDVLSKHFVEAVRRTEATLRQTNSSHYVDLVHVDWLNIVKDYNVDVGVATFWQNVVSFLGTTHNPSSSSSSQSPSTASGKPAAAPSGPSPSTTALLPPPSGSGGPPPPLFGTTPSTTFGPPPSILDMPSPAMSPAESPRSASPCDGFPQPSQTRSPLVTSGYVTQGGVLTTESCQSNFIRVNCADSLDRTNLGCFFTCLQASLEMMMVLGVSHSELIDIGPLPALPKEGSSDDEATLEPSEFAAQQDLLSMSTLDRLAGGNGQALRGGSKSPRGGGGGGPLGLSPRRKSSAKFSGLRSKTRKPFLRAWSDIREPSMCPAIVVRSLADLFVANGDTVAMMYTNTQALHTNLLRALCGMKPASSNVVLSAQRRFENVFEDKNKFRALEVLLGRNVELHFPTLSQVFLLRPLPYESWGWAIVVTGIPRGTTAAEIEDALRELWDARVWPQLPRSPDGTPSSIDSSALSMRVVVEEAVLEQELMDADAFVANESQVYFAPEPTPGSSNSSSKPPSLLEPPQLGNTHKRSTVHIYQDPEGNPLSEDPDWATVDDEDLRECDCIAVVEFDEDTCAIVDVARYFCQLQSFTLKRSLVSANPPLYIGRYNYPIHREDEKERGITASAGHAVKKAANSIKSGFKNFVRNLSKD